MAIIKCKMCGGDLNILEEATVAECEYCSSKQTIPNQDNEKKLTLFARADRLRRACEFDKAAGVYESIVADFPEEAEAYWGLVLCRYGIEYVDDPATGKKVPTCHRSSFDSILEDADFDQACENADAIARRVYRDEAKAIEDIRRGILEVSGREEPYDIFICYKETDEDGNRTIDSVIAQDVYDALTEKGYRTFFSRISLEDKLGTEYEPYIFAALNSAKIMLVFGSDFEHFNAVWVKNEWSRFLALIAAGQKKVLIPCYKGVDAYDMPKEFQRLQAQDMGKVGAVQDLLRGIEKLLDRGGKPEAAETTAQQNAGPGIDSLLKRGYLALEDGEWKKADDFFEQALNLDPENGDAYAGKLCVGMKYHSLSAIAQDPETWGGTEGTGNGNYKKILRYGTSALKAEIEGYIAAAVDTWKKDTYAAACKSMDKGDYQAAIKDFNCIKGYQDADEKFAECARRIEEIYVSACSVMDAGDSRAAMKQFSRIKGYRDVDAKLLEYGRKRAALVSRLISGAYGFTVALKSNGTIITTLDPENVEAARTMKTWTNVVAISAGEDHVVGLKTDGTVVAVGINKNGRCNVKNWRGIVAISTGESHTVGLRADGTVVATHADLYRTNWTDIVAVSAGDGCTAALKADGTVVTAGWLDARDWTDIVAVSAGNSHAVGLKADGTVVVVGENKSGQCDVGKWTDIVAVSVGNDKTVGLKADGTVVKTGIMKDEVLPWTDIVAISSSSSAYHIIGLRSDGVVAASASISTDGCKAQGWKLFGSIDALERDQIEIKRRQEEELRHYEEEQRRLEEEHRRKAEAKRQQEEAKRRQEEEQRRQELRRKEEERQEQERRKRRKKKIRNISILVLLALAAAAFLMFMNYLREQYAKAEALLEAGSYDEAAAIFKELGDYSDAKERCSKASYQMAEKLLAAGDIPAAAMAFGMAEDYLDARSRSFALWDEIAVRNTISAGSTHTAGLRSDGTVTAVGLNVYGRCDVEDWTEMIEVSVHLETVGLKADGTVVTTDSRLQRDVEKWTDIVAVSAGRFHIVGLKSDGTVVAVGDNQDNQCNVKKWTDIVAVFTGNCHTVGLKSDGTAVAVGENNYGQCNVSDWTDIVAISAGYSHTVGLKSDGTVVAVGGNDYGQCDVKDWADIVAISSCESHTVGLKSDGTVVTVGGNDYGQCDVKDWTSIVAISTGSFSHTVGLRSDGTVVAIGNNNSGQCDVSAWSGIKLPNSEQYNQREQYDQREQYAQAYLDILNRTNPDDSYLIDFDGDGQNELLTVYTKKMSEWYSQTLFSVYQGETALVIDAAMEEAGGPDCFVATKDGRAYIGIYNAWDGGWYTTYYTVDHGHWVEALKLQSSDDNAWNTFCMFETQFSIQYEYDRPHGDVRSQLEEIL